MATKIWNKIIGGEAGVLAKYKSEKTNGGNAICKVDFTRLKAQKRELSAVDNLHSMGYT